MNRYFALLLVPFLLFGCVGESNAPEPTLVVEGGRVIVGNGPVLKNASVVMSGDSILSVTNDSVEAPGARRIDASGKTVLPGLIDAHVHLIVPPAGLDSLSVVRFFDDGLPEVLQNLLGQGITTVRSTGDMWPQIGRIRDRIRTGQMQGPRIVTAGPVFTAKGGHPAATVCKGSPFCRSHHTREVSKPEQARKEVRKLAEEGVDLIKIVSDGLRDRVPIKDTVVHAIVDQAHREGLKAVGHVALAEDMIKYARLGMDGFVHPPWGTASTLVRHSPQRISKVFADRGTPVTTTLSTRLHRIEPLLRGNAPKSETVALRSKHIATLADAGVPIVVRTDWNPSGKGYPAADGGTAMIAEMRLLRRGGMSRHEIIQAATATAARALEMGDQVGTLEAGKLADLIVVDGNPLKDLSALDSIETVVQGGEVVAGEPE